uniref:Secreted protein n=1 Tax=Rhabditophanes sp. KR3021 TaxID=114890 RepID=A0AC35TJX5_9BILA
MNTRLICLVLSAVALSASALTCNSKAVGLEYLQIKGNAGSVATCKGTAQCIKITGTFNAKPIAYSGCFQDYLDSVEPYISRPELLKPNACNTNKLEVARNSMTPVTLCSCSTANCNK